MRPVGRTALVIVVVGVALTAGLAGGWYWRADSTPASTSPGSTTLSLIAAGTLAPVLPSMAAAFAAATPGVSAPTAAELYEGSTAAATALTLPGQPYDLFVAADFRVIPQHLERPSATVASWEIVFAADPLVLAYAPGVAGLQGLNSSNWYEKIVTPGILLGAPNASTDPLGANVVFALELTDELTGQSGGLYGHFFAGGIGGFAIPTAATRTVAENFAATALATDQVSTYFTYRSYALANHLSYVALNDSVDLGSVAAPDVARYGSVSSTVLAGSSTAVVKGAPVLFALTVPLSAPEFPLGVAFADYLASNATAAIWASDGFMPLAPLWTDAPASLPAALAGTGPTGVAPLPPYLSSLIA